MRYPVPETTKLWLFMGTPLYGYATMLAVDFSVTAQPLTILPLELPPPTAPFHIATWLADVICCPCTPPTAPVVLAMM